MIEKVLLASYRGSEVNDNTIVLWPRLRKPIVINPEFSISHYIFKVILNTQTTSLRISINDLEFIELTLVEECENSYHYHSERLSAKYFLGFNLGILEFSLKINFEKFQLTTLNSKQKLLSKKSLSYIYDTVARSDFFSFYISRYLRSNAPAKIVDDNSAVHFWIRLATAKDVLAEVSRFFSGELEFTSRVNNVSKVKKYNNKSVVEERDIQWLMENPNEMFVSNTGEISYLGIKHDINFMSQTIMQIDFNTYENRLIISCLYSIKSSLEEIVFDFEGDDFFPRKAIQELLTEVDNYLSKIISKLNLLPPFDLRPEYTNKYLDDTRYNKLFELIAKWYSSNDLMFGNELLSPILGITTIFEHYCFIKIIEDLQNIGFKTCSEDRKNIDIISKTILERGNEIISIYYEPRVSTTEFKPLNCSKKTTYYEPDFVVIYENNKIVKHGVIDAKFTTLGMVGKKLGPDIFYKYGLFFHKPDGAPIDFVYAMYPSLNEDSSFSDFRNDTIDIQVTPALGYFSIPFHEDATNFMGQILNPLIYKKDDLTN